jgi:hypothetical protein
MILQRKTFDGATNTSTVVNLSDLGDALGLEQYLCDFNVEISGNSAAVIITGKGSFADSAFRAVSGGDIAIGGGHVSLNGYALSQFNFATTGSAYKIMITRQLSSV